MFVNVDTLKLTTCGLKFGIVIVRVLNKLNVVYTALAFILIFLAHIAAMYVEPFEFIF
jgi:hypothetical protein